MCRVAATFYTTRVFLFGQTCTFSGYTFTRFWSEILHLPFYQAVTTITKRVCDNNKKTAKAVPLRTPNRKDASHITGENSSKGGTTTTQWIFTLFFELVFKHFPAADPPKQKRHCPYSQNSISPQVLMTISTVQKVSNYFNENFMTFWVRAFP